MLASLGASRHCVCSAQRSSSPAQTTAQLPALQAALQVCRHMNSSIYCILLYTRSTSGGVLHCASCVTVYMLAARAASFSAVLCTSVSRALCMCLQET